VVVSIQLYLVTGTKWNQQEYLIRIQEPYEYSGTYLMSIKPIDIPIRLIGVHSRDPGTHQAVNRATQGPHLSHFSVLKIATHLG
jgi:hypothetical protein